MRIENILSLSIISLCLLVSAHTADAATLVRYAGQVTSNGGYENMDNAVGEPDGDYTTGPAMQVLQGWNFDFPLDDNVITRVQVSIYSKNDTSNGLVMKLYHNAGSSKQTFTHDNWQWDVLDITDEDDHWTWGEVNDLRLYYSMDEGMGFTNQCMVQGFRVVVEYIPPTPTPTSTPSSTPTPSPTNTPTVTNTPTITPTPEPTGTPTKTPTDTPSTPPKILMAGYMNSRITASGGGSLDLLAWVTDPDGADIARVQVYFNRVPTELELPVYDRDNGVFYLQDVPVGAGLPPIDYLLELKAEDFSGNKSGLWPYLNIWERPDGLARKSSYQGAGFSCFHDVIPWEIQQLMTLNSTTSKEAVSPYILLAGYKDTELFEGYGGMLKLLAAVNDPQGLHDIMKVELCVYGQPTGLELFDDGYHEDFQAGDSIYGFAYNIPEISADMVGDYLLEIIATDWEGNQSDPWPYLRIH